MSCSTDRTIRFWALQGESWTLVDTLSDGHDRTVRSVAFAPNGRTIASTSFDGTTLVWNKEDAEYSVASTLEGHENEVKCVAFSVSGNLVATCGRDKSVWIWEGNILLTGSIIEANSSLAMGDCDYECVAVLQDHTQDVKMIVWHPHEDVLASCSYDDTIRIWKDDGDEWICMNTLEGHSSTVWAIDFDPTGNFLGTALFSEYVFEIDCVVSVSDDLSIKIWKKEEKSESTGGALSILSWSRKVAQWTCVSTLENAHSRCIYSVSWSKVNGLIATASGDNSIKIFKYLPDENRLELLHTINEAHSQFDVNCVRWCPLESNGTLLASCGDDDLIRIWDIKC